jgi:ubiquitin-activating enzyme E1
MCTLQNFPYLPVHCIEWARAQFNQFESEPKLYNTFIENSDKFFEQLSTAQGEERYEIISTMKKFIALDRNNLFTECIRRAFDSFCEQHITRIKNLIHLFPEDEVVKDKDTGDVIGRFWSGHKKFPQVPKFDLANDEVLDYLYCAANLWASVFGAEQVRDREQFRKLCESAGLTVPEWTPPVGLKIQVDDDDNAANDNADDETKNDADEAKEKEIAAAIEMLRALDKSKLLQKMNEAEFEKDDDTNFHIDYITAVANTRARNYRIKETSRHQCKIIAGKIIAALATTTAMICGLVELEFYKLKLGLAYIHQDAFYNANINLAVSQFQFFQPDAAIKAEERT